MKALLITFEFGDHALGGLARVINGVTEELRHHVELDVYLLYFNPARLAISAKVFRCDRDQSGRLLATFTRGYARHCVELIEEEKYDVVHFFSVHWIVRNILDLLTKELPEQRIVYSIHSLIKHEQGTRLNPRSFLACERELIQSAALVHVLNHTSRGYFERAYPDLAAVKPFRVIPNGIQAQDVSPTDEGLRRTLAARLRSGIPTLMCLSRWTHGKGLEHYVAAAEKLLERGHDVQFVLAGRKYISWEKRWYSYVARIQRMARRLGDRLIVLGWLNAAQRNTLFERCDVAVMPSELEYYPYSVLEPVAAGMPLVCSDLPCVRELLDDRTECLLFRTGDAEDLADKLASVCTAPVSAVRMAERARARVLRTCDWTAIARDYARMYRDAVAPSDSVERAGAA